MQGGNHAIYNVWEKLFYCTYSWGLVRYGLVLVGAKSLHHGTSFPYISSPNGRCQFEPLLPTDSSLLFWAVRCKQCVSWLKHNTWLKARGCRRRPFFNPAQPLPGGAGGQAAVLHGGSPSAVAGGLRQAWLVRLTMVTRPPPRAHRI
jgi:hypothetical protein